MATQSPILEIRNLSMTFGGGRSLSGRERWSVKAVRDASLRIRRGTTMGLVGESGSGKSTLGRCATLLTRPTAGDVRFRDESLVEASHSRLTELRRGFQTVFQDPYSSLNPRKTVERLIGEPLVIHDVGTAAERREKVEAIMDLVGLRPDQRSLYPHEFSGGQRQRIAIARALVIDPDLLVLDEPTSALDVSVQAQIVNLLLRLQAELGLTYLFISHNLHLVRHISDDVAVMTQGQIVETGSAAEVFASPHQEYTRRLVASAV